MSTGTDQHPHDDAAERRVLGAVLIAGDPSAAREILEPVDFYREHHAAAFGAMLEAADAGETLDTIAVIERLRRSGMTDGASLLAGCIDATPSSVGLGRDAELVAEAPHRRQLIAAAERLRTGAADPGADADELLREVASMVTESRSRGWSERPTPLSATPETPAWPGGVFPDWLDSQVAAVSDFCQTPPDLAGMIALATLSAAARGRYDVEAPAEELPRLLADDATFEALGSLLAQQGGRLALLSAEGGIFDLAAGLYNDGKANLDVLLKGHDGEPIRVDRKGRPAEHIPRAPLTVGLAIQPSVLHSAAETSRFRGRGLLARFLYTLPASLVGRRAFRCKPPPPAVVSRYERNIRELLDAAPGEVVSLRCSPVALARWERFAVDLEPRLDPQLGDLAVIGDFASKLPGSIARIAGLLHLAREGSGAIGEPVSEETMARALRLGPYIIGHARAAFAAMGADPRVEAAKRCIQWVEREGLRTFSAREIYHGLKGTFPTMDELRPALATLVDHNCIRELPAPKQRRPGRRPSPKYEVHPLIPNSRYSRKGSSQP